MNYLSPKYLDLPLSGLVTRPNNSSQIKPYRASWKLAAVVKMEIPVLVRSMKSSILSSTSFQMGKTFWGVVRAAVDQSRRKANMVA